VLQFFELFFQIFKSNRLRLKIIGQLFILGHQLSQLDLHLSTHLIHLHPFDSFQL